MTSANALRDIHGYAAAGRVRFVWPHAYKRMDERGATARDVIHALRTATGCRLQENGRWKVFGKDLEGDELTIIAEIEDGLLVVTLF